MSRWRSNRICSEPEPRARGPLSRGGSRLQHHPSLIASSYVANEFQAPPSTRLGSGRQGGEIRAGLNSTSRWGRTPGLRDTTLRLRPRGWLTLLFTPRSNHSIQCYLRSSRCNTGTDRRNSRRMSFSQFRIVEPVCL